MISTAQYNLSTPPTQILADTVAAETVYIHVSGGSAYLGADATVTSSTGYILDNGDKIQINSHNGALYAGSSASASISVMVIEK